MRILFVSAIFLASFLVHAVAFAQFEMAGSEIQYSHGDGSPAFILRLPNINNQTFDATLKMTGSDEVWTLQKSQGAGGAVIYKNDVGRIFLRANHRDSATLYPTPDSLGIPVLKASEFGFETITSVDPAPQAQLKSVEDWSRVYAYAGNKKADTSVKSGDEAIPANIKFSDWPHSQSEFKSGLIAHLSGLMGNELTENIERIVVKIGNKPAAIQQDTDLIIWVNPALGFAGRPSTEKIRADLINNKG